MLNFLLKTRQNEFAVNTREWETAQYRNLKCQDDFNNNGHLKDYSLRLSL